MFSMSSYPMRLSKMLYGLNGSGKSIMVGWLFNGTTTQKGQFVPTVGDGNRLSRLRMANEIRCIGYYLTLHDNNVTQFTVKHSS